MLSSAATYTFVVQAFDTPRRGVDLTMPGVVVATCEVSRRRGLGKRSRTTNRGGTGGSSKKKKAAAKKAPAKKKAAAKKAPARKKAAAKKAPARKKAAAKKAPATQEGRQPRRLRRKQEGSGQEEGRREEGSGQARRLPAKKAPAKQEGRGQEGSGQEEGSGEEGSGPQGNQEALTGSPTGAGGAVCTDGGWPDDRSGHPRSGGRGPDGSVRGRAPRTWNVNSLNARHERVEAWLAECQPDVVCMQETKLADTAFPAMAFSALGYESVHHGEGRWNGVAILSRVGLDDVVTGFADGEPADAEARLVTATCGGVRVMSALRAQRPRPRPRALPVQAALARAARRPPRRRRRPDGRRWRCAATSTSRPTDRDVWDPTALVGATHVSAPERAALRRLLDWGLTDVFRDQYPDTERLFSWWDYRAGNFHKGIGMRIDLVLGSAAVRRARARGRSSTATPARASSRPTTPRSSSSWRMSRERRRRRSAADTRRVRPGWAARIQELRDIEPTPRRAALFRVADAIRGVLHRMVQTSAPDEVIEAAAADVEAAAERFGGYTEQVDVRGLRRGRQRRRAVRLLRPQPDARAGQPAGPADRACGSRATASVGTATFGAAYEGPPGCVHGGYVAAAFDEVLGSTQSLSGSPGHDRAAHRPLPQPDARCRPSCGSWAGSRTSTAARSSPGASCGPATCLCAEAEGLFISIDLSKFADAARPERDRRHGRRATST